MKSKTTKLFSLIVTLMLSSVIFSSVASATLMFVNDTDLVDGQTVTINTTFNIPWLAGYNPSLPFDDGSVFLLETNNEYLLPGTYRISLYLINTTGPVFPLNVTYHSGVPVYLNPSWNIGLLPNGRNYYYYDFIVNETDKIDAADFSVGYAEVPNYNGINYDFSIAKY